jgi:hypothetical protein
MNKKLDMISVLCIILAIALWIFFHPAMPAYNPTIVQGTSMNAIDFYPMQTQTIERFEPGITLDWFTNSNSGTPRCTMNLNNTKTQTPITVFENETMSGVCDIGSDGGRHACYYVVNFTDTTIANNIQAPPATYNPQLCCTFTEPTGETLCDTADQNITILPWPFGYWWIAFLALIGYAAWRTLKK